MLAESRVFANMPHVNLANLPIENDALRTIPEADARENWLENTRQESAHSDQIPRARQCPTGNRIL